MRSEVLRIEFLNKSFEGGSVLRNISFNVLEGETLALIGANGAGKTSLINIISGLMQGDSGNMWFRGQPAQIRSPLDAKLLGIYSASDRNRIVDTLTVAENIFLGRERSRWVSFRKLAREAQPYMDEAGLRAKPETMVGSLSQREKALVQFACILAANPMLLIIDEPSLLCSDMDSAELFRIIQLLNKRGCAVIYITHSLTEAMDLGDRILVLRNGQAAGLYLRGLCTREQLIDSISGKDAPRMQVTRQHDQETVVDIRELNGIILENISFQALRGEILGVTGVAGAGKTELINLMYGLSTPKSGDVYYFGERMSGLSPSASVKNGVAYVMEDIETYGGFANMTVSENITASAMERISSLGWINRRAESFFAENYLAAVHALNLKPNAYIKELSDGARQKVQIAKCLAARPKIVLMDEPIRNMDVDSKSDVSTLLAKLSTEGVTTIVASADVDYLLEVCDRLLILHSGVLKGEVAKEEASINRVVEITQR